MYAERSGRDDPNNKTMDELVALVQSLEDGVASKDEAIASRAATIRLMVEQARLPKHKSFGRLSERLSPDQCAMLFNEVETASAVAANSGLAVSPHEIPSTVTNRKPSGR